MEWASAYNVAARGQVKGVGFRVVASTGSARKCISSGGLPRTEKWASA